MTFLTGECVRRKVQHLGMCRGYKFKEQDRRLSYVLNVTVHLALLSGDNTLCWFKAGGVTVDACSVQTDQSFGWLSKFHY